MPKYDFWNDSPSESTASAQEADESTSWLNFIKPYRIDIQQGNFVSKEQAAQLHEGMTKDQVRFVLGSPLLKDMFHSNRWDYIFRLKKGNGEVTSNRLTVFFTEDRVARIDSTPLPDEAAYLREIADKKN